MTLIRRPPPITDLMSLRDTLDQLFDERFMRPFFVHDGERRVVPALDLYITPEAVIAKVALPGVRPEDVDVSISDDIVTISGSFHEEKESAEEGFVHRELSRGSFSRSFSIPMSVKADVATATFQDGLLTLTLPKSEEVKPKHIKVEVT